MNRAPLLELDGASLPEELRSRFERLVQVIARIAPVPRALILAEEALRKTCIRTPSGWVSLRSYALDGGRGPVLRLRREP